MHTSVIRLGPTAEELRWSPEHAPGCGEENTEEHLVLQQRRWQAHLLNEFCLWHNAKCIIEIEL